jgi:hypothetical protein
MPCSFGELGIGGTPGINTRWVSAPALTAPIKTPSQQELHDRWGCAGKLLRQFLKLLKYKELK